MKFKFSSVAPPQQILYSCFCCSWLFVWESGYLCNEKRLLHIRGIWGKTRLLRKKWLYDDLVHRPSKHGEQQGRQALSEAWVADTRASLHAPICCGHIAKRSRNSSTLCLNWIKTFITWKPEAITRWPFLSTSSLVVAIQVCAGTSMNIFLHIFSSYYFIKVNGKWNNKCSETKVKMCKHHKLNIVKLNWCC